MDINMPVMDGFVCTENLKKMIDSNEIPRATIICVTAYDSKMDREQIINKGADGFLKKPFIREDLL